MERRQLGKSGIGISKIIVGTWQAGGNMWVGINDDDIKKGLYSALDAGVNAVDTASVYGHGRSERLVGEAFRGMRHDVVVATKVFCNALTYDKLMASCEKSLRNLGTDYIDLYQIHWPSGTYDTPVVPIEESMRALRDLKTQGKIRAIGVSNFSADELREALEFGPIDSLQPPYSLFWRQVERGPLPVCAEHGLSVLAYSPLAQGILTGKFGPDQQFEKGDHRSTNRLFQPDLWEHVQQALAKLRVVSKKVGASLAEVALAWVLAQPATHAIAGMRNAAQARENARAAALQLSGDILAALDEVSRIVTDRLDDNPRLWV